MSSRFISQLFYSVLSAVFLVLSFPNANFLWLAWVGFVPLLIVIDRAGKKGAFGYAYLTGFLFFFSVLFWIHHVTFLGLFFLTAYLALYFGLFGLAAKGLSGRSFSVRLIALPAGWVVLEFVRAHFLSGFGWAALGHSQASNTLLIQMADITGVGGVSFVLVAFNVLAKEYWVRLPQVRTKTSGLFPSAVAVLFFLAVILGYGAWRIQSLSRDGGEKVRIAVVQGNVPLEEFWSPAMKPGIVERYLALSREAVKAGPDLVVWPESSFPNFLWDYSWLWRQVKGFPIATGTPLLLGAVTRQDEAYFNSALFIGEDGEVRQRYDKIHLVLFGEYIPLRKELPWLAAIVPIDDFTAGRNWTVFDEVRKAHFATLICFEDTLPWMARHFARDGATFFVNITNDAWFQDSPQPFMHLDNAIFRTVENRRPLVRATNTGVSCFVNDRGMVEGCVQDSAGRRLLTAGWLARDITPGRGVTFYTKFGDIFTLLCFLAILNMLFIPLKRKGHSYE